MTTLYTISDDRTKFCRKAMKANDGVWNPVTSAWMFTKADDHGNAMCELYRATRPSGAQLEALLTTEVYVHLGARHLAEAMDRTWTSIFAARRQSLIGIARP